ncbi:MAG: EAL domain-containing protein [Paucibacter sp.]|nr:EAL domain-containing protein [Roseateles sp.]
MQLPAFLNVRRLEGRIVAVFLSLLLVVQMASFAVIDRVITRNANNDIAAELQTGEKVFHRLLAQQAEKRRDAAALLAQDYGFKQTIALPRAEAGTMETIQDALANQGQRIGATVVAYFDNELNLVAATRPEARRFQELLKKRVDGSAADDAQLVQLDGKPYQVVAQPVRTPAPRGWVLMGFALDASLLEDLKSLSELQAIVVRREAGWQPLVSRFGAADSAQIAAQVPPDPENFAVHIQGEQWRGHLVPLGRAGEPQIGVVLLRSFDAAVAPFRDLQLSLLGLTALGVLVFALLSVLLARAISGPIKSLSESAARLGSGDYATPVQRHSRDEVGDLADAFEAMRKGIRAQTAKVDRLAYWDELTGLPNGAQLRARLEECCAAGRPLAVLMLDLDRFKHVNDVLGQEFGDALLQRVGERLSALCSGPHRMLARLAGDEFALMIEGADEDRAIESAQEILRDFERPLRIEAQTVDLGAGIGIVLAPQHGQDARALLARAELAMYAAKQRRCGQLVYSSALDAGSQDSLSLLSELRQAIERNELCLYMQPKIGVAEGRVIGAEALVRWQHPQRGMVPPMAFIPFAEQTGFIRTLTSWVIAEAARFLASAHASDMPLKVSVNLSTRDLMDPGLPSAIQALVSEFALPPGSLCLEITESAIMDDPQRALSTLEQLSNMGFKLSIDDFGTGYSSLAYLKRLPVDELKIDKSFVMGMERDLDDAKIVRSTIELAHNLGLSVVAEGVETSGAWQLLARLGCDEAQGYFMAKPMPASELLSWASDWQLPDGTPLTDSIFARLDA